TYNEGIHFWGPLHAFPRSPALVVLGIMACANIKFVQNSQKAYNVSDYSTVDEMLVPFRERMIYMPMKQAEYGLKLMCSSDVKNNYFYNSYIYTGYGLDGDGLPDEEKKKQYIPSKPA
ncbi:hypothetical protein HHI36_003481, partial [Cryptolaemus montrouzieri]